MESVLTTADDFVVITGEEGSGKTVLVNTFRLELEKTVAVAHLLQAPISSNELLQALLEQFGYLPFRGNKSALLSTLKGYFAEQRKAGRKVLLLVDEAQNLAPPLLEQLRALLQADAGRESTLRVILVGRPALSELLDAPEVTPLGQRARLRFHLTALSPDQLHGYVMHRLAIAGSHGREIFQPGCFEVIDRYTGGAPRLINSLCDGALRTAAARGRDQVLAEDVEAAAFELKLPSLRDRPVAVESAPAPQAAPEAERAPAATEPPRSADPAPAALAKDLAGARVARLRVMSAGQLLVEHTLRVGRRVIGRAPDADLQIEDRTISRHHCQIISNDYLSVVQDLNSTNGVYVKDQRVRRHNLSDGDVIVLGSFQVHYLDEREGEQPDYQGEIAPPLPRIMQAAEGEITQN
jgi:general secretion pathway protein A